MRFFKWIYEKKNKKPAPYYYNYSVFTVIFKPIRKWITNTLAANCPFNCVRIALYRLCGFKIGRHTFIGMKCYLDDMCYDILTIGSNVIISYGVFFACHGKNQKHLPITVEDGAYIGMRANVISKNAQAGGAIGKNSQKGIVIGRNAIIGACTLVNRDIPPGATAVGIPCRILSDKENITIVEQ